MSVVDDRRRLLQDNMLQRLRQDVLPTEMVTVYWSHRIEPHNHGIYCGLIPAAKIEKTLACPTWDFSHGQGFPGAVEHHQGDKQVVEYLRYGNNKGMEPLVIDRHFHQVHADYKEISEEFRLFHDLYHDRKLDQYFKIDSDGNERLIIVIEPDRIQIRLKEIRQFLAVKEMYLAVQFDCREHSSFTLAELNLEAGGKDHREGLMCWGLCFGELRPPGSTGAFSRLLGKRLISPFPKEKSGFWGFAEEEPKKYVDFIIGIDEDGAEVIHASDPDTLGDNFGGNRDAPHYLTAVHFSKEVLDKYYQQPGKYLIQDGMLHCAGLWALYIDNHHDDKVCAWLGDLGRDLSYEEQLHWRAYNIPPADGMSETFIRRQLLAQSTNSNRLEHVFLERYRELAQASEEHLGWCLLLPLNQEDEHYLQCVRVPSTDEQREFDELVLGSSF